MDSVCIYIYMVHIYIYMIGFTIFFVGLIVCFCSDLGQYLPSYRTSVPNKHVFFGGWAS